MKLIYVNEIPAKRRSKHRLQIMLDEFMESNEKMAKIEFNETDYKSAKVCYGCIGTAVRKSKRNLNVAYREGVVYIIKK